MGTNKAVRDTYAGDKRGEFYIIKFSKIKRRPGFNVREDFGDIPELAASIVEEGVKQPMQGYREDGFYYYTDGDRRYTALEYQFKKDKIDRDVKFILEPRGYTDVQRTMDMLTYATGKPLTEIEKAKGIKRLLAEGLKEAEIAKKMGCSQAYVNRLNQLNGAEPELIELVKKNRISATTAIDQLVKDKDGGKGFVELVQSGAFDKPEGVNLFSLNGGVPPTAEPAAAPSQTKHAKITGRDISKVKGTGKSKPETQQDDDAPAVINSWAKLKSFIKSGEFKPTSDEGKKRYLFLGKLMDNKLEEKDFKKFFN